MPNPRIEQPREPRVTITPEDFLSDRQGRTFTDVVNDPDCPFQDVLESFNDENWQRRMEESEIHHDRAPMAGVVRELEAQPAINQFLAGENIQRTKRFRQAIGVLVRIIMQRRGWRKTGRKGSLGVRAATPDGTAAHNTGGLAFWFIRAERYELNEGMPFRTVRERNEELDAGESNDSTPKERGKTRSRKRRTPARQTELKSTSGSVGK